MTEAQGTSRQDSRASLLTFLLADVRGYTRFTNEHGDEAAARLADRFAQFCEEILGGHDGRVIELRGDEALAVFPSARDALRGAVALQQAFKQSVADDPSLPLNVGIGLDTGEAIPVRGGYRGGALNLAARLCSIAGAGEILASEGVIHVARKTEGLIFVDRGQVTLKGLVTPVRVLQIAPEGELPEALPPLQPILVTHPTNLPDEPTPFIGREEEISIITGLLRDPHIRLVTLTGWGGTGKTRLALQVGSALLYDYGDGVFFCDLAPLSDSDLIPYTIAAVLGVKEEGGRPLMDVLIEHLRAKHILLVLDNFEHLIEAAPQVGQLLDACRELHILVTSRVPLHLSRENEHSVPPLTVPDLSRPQDTTDLTQYESVALFIQRAKSAKDSFAVTDENAPAVAEICARLDGLPLALELAAARIKLFPPQALLQRLDSRLRLLTGGARDKPTRQQTLRGAIDWSYGLLSDDEQVLFARLSVFAGGWSFEAAELVCDGDGETDVLEGMMSLVDKSLIKQDGEDEPRFSILETIREYAAEKLRERGAEEAMRAAHAAFYLDETARESSEELGAWLERIDREVDNLRSAFSWSLTAEPERALAAAIDVAPYADHRGRYSECVAWLETASERAVEAPLTLRARGLSELSELCRMLGKIERAVAAAEKGLLLARDSGDEAVLAYALRCVAGQAMFHGDIDRAVRAVDEGTPVARRVGQAGLLADFLEYAGLIAVGQGNLSGARSTLDEAWALYRQAGAPSSSTYNLAGLAILDDDPATARAWAEEGLGHSPSRSHRFLVAHLQEMVARSLILAGDTTSPHELLESAVHVHRETEAGICPAHSMEAFARLALARGELERAVTLLSASVAIQQSLGMTMMPIERLLLDQTVGSARQAIDESAYARAWAEGAGMSVDEAIAYALSGTKWCS